jgi:4'-phosphopantetheinyl transferase
VLVSDPGLRVWPPADVVVRVLPLDDEPASADRALADLVAAYLQVRVDQVNLGRLCPQCASTDHGRPVVRPVDGRRVHVSIARTLGRAAVAAGSVGPVGVDIERVDADRFVGVARVARDGREPEATMVTEVAARWARKEAVLKATGWGVTWGPDRVNVTPDRPSPFPVRVGSGSNDIQVWVTDLDVGTGYAAAVAVVSPGPPQVPRVE